MRSLRSTLSLALAGALGAFALAAAPAHAETGPAVRITEFAYGGQIATGGDGEYIELTNTGDSPQDMTDWSYNNVATAGVTSLSGLGTLAAGESAVLTDADPAAFRADWGLDDSVKVISDGSASLNKGPSGVHIFDAANTEVDSVTYAQGFFPGKGTSAWVDAAHVGAKSDTTGWTLSTADDGEGSWMSATGSIGSPGASTLGTSTPADVRTGGDSGGDGDVPPDDPNYADIVINEVTSDNSGTVDFAPDPDIGDAIELYNKGSHDIDLAGWKQIDSGDASAATDFSSRLYVDGTLATVIPAGHYGVFQSGKGLSSGGDAVKIYTQNGTLVDSLSFTAGQAGVDETVNTDHAYHSLAACPDGSDTFKEVPTATFGESNGDCPGGIDPLTGGGDTGPEAPCDTEDSGSAPGTVPADSLVWPGGDSPTTIDDQCAWVTSLSGQDLSGLAFDPNDADVLYAVKNKSHVYRLVRSGGGWAKDASNGWADGKDIRFPGGTGLPDSEGLAVGPDGSLYITTERDNAASGVPLDSILRFDPTSSATTLVASDQWVLTDDLGFTNADANLGFEGVAYVPDSFLVSVGFRTDDGALYNPANYPSKATGGVFFAAVEKTGHLRAYVLNSDHTYARVADVDTGMAGVMDDSFDPDLGRIWAHCDNTCGNATALLRVGSDGHFGVEHHYSRPANLPNYNLEGFAVAPYSTASNGAREVLWTDDGDRFGHSLWSGSISTTLGLPPISLTTHAPTVSGAAKVGKTLVAHVASWGPGTVKLSYAWLAGGRPIAGASGSSLRLTPALRGKAIGVRVTGTETGYITATAQSRATSAVKAGTITAKRPKVTGKPKVGKRLVAHPRAWRAGGSKVTFRYQWYVNGKAIRGATKARLKVTRAYRGKKIKVKVIGRAVGYAKAAKTSVATRKIRR